MCIRLDLGWWSFILFSLSFVPLVPLQLSDCTNDCVFPYQQKCLIIKGSGHQFMLHARVTWEVFKNSND